MHATMTLQRPPPRQSRRSAAAAAVILASSISAAHAANSTVEWHFTPGTATHVDVPACRDQQGLVLSAPSTSTAGAVNATIRFQGSSITLYGTRYDQGAPALIVVDGDYMNAKHADESLAAATINENPNACIQIASFTALSNNRIGHTLEVILQGDAVAPMTFTIANVTMGVHDDKPLPSRGPHIGAIVGPIVAIVLLIAGGIFFWLFRRRRIRNARKAPSAAFRAEHPALPMGNIHNANGGVQSEDGFSPRHMALSPALAGPSHSAASSGSTLVADLDDEKKKLADILAVRDAHRLEIQAQLMSARDTGERLPWDTRQQGVGSGAGNGGWNAPGRGTGRGLPMAGWDPGDAERDPRY